MPSISIFHRRARSDAPDDSRRDLRLLGVFTHVARSLSTSHRPVRPSRPSPSWPGANASLDPPPKLAPRGQLAPTFTFPPSRPSSDKRESEGTSGSGLEAGTQKDDSDTESMVDSIFSVMSDWDDDTPAHVLLIRELEASLSALASANATLQLRVSLLRALVRRLTRQYRLVRAQLTKAVAHRSSSDITPTGVPRSEENHSATETTIGDHYHLADVIARFPAHQLKADFSSPNSPEDVYFSGHSRSSSEANPRGDILSLSSFPPPTPTTSTQTIPTSIPVSPKSKLHPHTNRPGGETASLFGSVRSTPSRSRTASARSSVQSSMIDAHNTPSGPSRLGPTPPVPGRKSLQVPRVSEPVKQERRSSRVSVLSSFLPSRGSTTRAPTNLLNKPNAEQSSRPSLQISISKARPSHAKGPTSPVVSRPRAVSTAAVTTAIPAAIAAASAVAPTLVSPTQTRPPTDTRSRIPALSNIRIGAMKLRDSIRRRSRMPAEPKVHTASSSH